MTSFSLRRKTSFLVFGAFLLLPWAIAAEPHGRVDLSNFFERLWSNLTAVWSQAGCSADPDGRCLPAPTTDEGCSADPDGRCGSGI